MSHKVASRARKREAETEKRRIAFAFVLSLFLHLGLILLVAVTVRMRPVVPLPEADEEDMLEVVFTEPEPAQPVETKPVQPTYVETVESQRQEEAPKDSTFESDKNTHAASDQAPTGTLPLPSTEGRESKAIEWQDRTYAEGETPREDAVMGQPMAQAETPPEKPLPTPEPIPTPEPVPEVTPEPASPVPTPLNTPPPVMPEPTPAPTALALLDPPIRPSARADAHRPRPERPPTPEAAAARPARPGFQPETRTTRIQGGLTNRGRPALNATATPLGKYKKMLSDAIGSRWYYYVNRQIDLVSIGTIEIRFIVERDGKARSVRVMSNTSNESFASVSLRSILEANIPPIPDEVAENLQAGRLEVDYTFTILSN